MPDRIIRTEPTPTQEIVLGEEYRDTVTGYVGVATAFHTYINGCIHVTLDARVDPSQPMPKDLTYQSFDEARLVRVRDEEPVKATASRGGPAGRTAPRP